MSSDPFLSPIQQQSGLPLEHVFAAPTTGEVFLRNPDTGAVFTWADDHLESTPLVATRDRSAYGALLKEHKLIERQLRWRGKYLWWLLQRYKTGVFVQASYWHPQTDTVFAGWDPKQEVSAECVIGGGNAAWHQRVRTYLERSRPRSSERVVDPFFVPGLGPTFITPLPKDDPRTGVVVMRKYRRGEGSGWNQDSVVLGVWGPHHLSPPKTTTGIQNDNQYPLATWPPCVPEVVDTFASEAAAQEAFETLESKYLMDGYWMEKLVACTIEPYVGQDAPSALSDLVQPLVEDLRAKGPEEIAPPPAKLSLIFNAPTDDAVRLEYADANDDAHATLAALQRDTKPTKEQKGAASKLIKARRSELLGPLDPVLRSALKFRLGFLEGCALKSDVPLGALIHSPYWTTVRELDCGNMPEILSSPTLVSLHTMTGAPCDTALLNGSWENVETLGYYSGSASGVEGLFASIAFPGVRKLAIEINGWVPAETIPWTMFADSKMAASLTSLAVTMGNTDTNSCWPQAVTMVLALAARCPLLTQATVVAGDGWGRMEFTLQRKAKARELTMKVHGGFNGNIEVPLWILLELAEAADTFVIKGFAADQEQTLRESCPELVP